MLNTVHLAALASLGSDNEARLEQIALELNRPISWIEVSFLVVFLAVAPLVAWMLFRRFGNSEPAEPVSNPKALFHELCDGHALEREERELLEQLARRAKFDPLSRIFFEPERLSEQQAGDLRPAQRLALKALQVKLFGNVAAGVS